jgi:S1-C subfamily serine protease
MVIVRKYFKKFYILVATILIFGPSLISCYGLAPASSKSISIYRSLPHKHFVRISTIQSIKPIGCNKKTKDIVKCKKFIKKLPEIKNRGTGSGGIVNTVHGKVILTAAHVCLNVNIKETSFKGHDIILKSKTLIYVSFVGIEGKFPAKIFKLNKKSDLCMLGTKDIPHQGLSLAAKKPSVGDKVFTVSAPLGITGENLSLIYAGYYSGHDRKLHYYTVPTRPGSSGSLVLDSNFNLVGTLNIAFTKLETVGMGAGHQDLKEFLKFNTEN